MAELPSEAYVESNMSVLLAVAHHEPPTQDLPTGSSVDEPPSEADEPPPPPRSHPPMLDMTKNFYNIQDHAVLSVEERERFFLPSELAIHDNFLRFFDIGFTLRKYYAVFRLEQKWNPTQHPSILTHLRDTVDPQLTRLSTFRSALQRLFCRAFPAHIAGFPHGNASPEVCYKWLIGFLEALRGGDILDARELESVGLSRAQIEFTERLERVDSGAMSRDMNAVVDVVERVDRRCWMHFGESLLDFEGEGGL